jgi:predicted PP-loop superfamily ATPase
MSWNNKEEIKQYIVYHHQYIKHELIHVINGASRSAFVGCIDCKNMHDMSNIKHTTRFKVPNYICPS